ncbi:MAG: rhomboid family intramembrane serine protease [Candidatus Njordarchaeota archaeon]
MIQIFIEEEVEIERIKPYVLWAIIAINVVIFIFEFVFPDIVLYYALVPSDIMSGKNLHTLVTSMFLHGSIIHILSNMYFAWVFCDDLENVYGHYMFIVFYLASGIGAGLIHALLSCALDMIFHIGLADIPCIGASGALFGALAAYSFFFPRRRLKIYSGYVTYTITAWKFAITYAIYESLMVILGLFDYVAHTAHVGGFVTGLLIAYVFKKMSEKRIETILEEGS